MSRTSWERKLKVINVVCRGLFLFNGFLSLVIGFGLTIPEYCDGDRDCLYRCKILAWYLFINISANYLCIILKSKLSNVSKDTSDTVMQRSTSLLLSPPTSSNFAWKPSFDVISNDDKIAENYHDQGFNGIASNYDLRASKMEYSYSGQSMEPNGFSSSSSRYSHPYQGSANVCEHIYSTTVSHDPKDFQCSITDLSNYNRHVSKTGISAESVSGPVLAGWFYCQHCVTMSPPRAKHCSVCSCCILKGDHHCFFAGCCVGFHNQRFFTVFCLQVGIGCSYALLFLCGYLSKHYTAVNSLGYIAYFPPVLPFVWLLGYTTLGQAGMVLFSFLNFLTASAGLNYFIMQIFLILRGQTKFECEQRIKTYRGTFRKNIRSVFGDFFPLNLFISIPFGGYHGDGIDWDEMCCDEKLL